MSFAASSSLFGAGARRPPAASPFSSVPGLFGQGPANPRGSTLTVGPGQKANSWMMGENGLEPNQEVLEKYFESLYGESAGTAKTVQDLIAQAMERRRRASSQLQPMMSNETDE